MAKEQKSFRHESLQDRRSIISYLQAILDGFENGKLTFQQEQDEVTLEPEGLMNFELRANRKRNTSDLALRFTWSGKPDDEGRGDPLQINGFTDE